MKPLVIYHANCADGFGAAFAAWLKLGDEAEYVPCQYGEDGLRADLRYGYTIKDRDVYILDFSFDRDLMNFYFANAKRVVWLDHHKTAFETFGFTPNAPGEPAVEPLSRHDCILDNNKSGAYLAWEYFHPGEEVPMFIRHIDDYDRWQFQLECTKAFNKALWSYAPWSFKQWQHEVDSTWSYPVSMLYYVGEGEAILRAHEQNVKGVVARSTRACRIPNYNAPQDEVDFHRDQWELTEPQALAEVAERMAIPGLAANCPPHLTSDVGHELAKQSGTFGLCWTFGQTGTVANCSLRSNGDYDVSAIAKSLGGGGHRNAAGFEIDIQTLLGWLK